MPENQNQLSETIKKFTPAISVLMAICLAILTFWILNEIDLRRTNPQNSHRYENAPAYRSALTQSPEEQILPPQTLKEEHTPAAQTSNVKLTENSLPPQSAMPRAHARNLHTPLGLPYTVNNGSPDRKLVALTFDGGSTANVAPEILDTLASRDVKCTMFLTGSFIRRFPQIVKRAADEGHEIANHTMTHPRMTTFASTRTQTTRPEITRQTVINELQRAEKTLMERTGLNFAPLWRSPYGEYNREICMWAIEAGYLHIGWRKGRTWEENLDTNDWVADENSPAFKTPDEVFDKIINMAGQPQGLNGGIVLMHLGTERKQRSQQVHLILGKLIDSLRSMGYETVTVSELLRQSEIDIGVLALKHEQLTYGI